MIFAWTVIVEEFLQTRERPLESGMFCAVLTCSILFSLSAEMIGFTMTRARNQEIVAAMRRFENPAPSAPEPFPVPPYRIQGPNGVIEGLKVCAQMRVFINRSIELGVYRPPRL